MDIHWLMTFAVHARPENSHELVRLLGDDGEGISYLSVVKILS